METEEDKRETFKTEKKLNKNTKEENKRQTWTKDRGDREEET